jgi:phytoene dehydrogenase-like protein
MPLRPHYDTVVVGGGHNGLIAATYLAKSGQSVLVLERTQEFGGAASSDRIFPGLDANISRYAYLVSLLPGKIVSDLDLHFSSRPRRIASCTPYQQDGPPGALLLSNSDPSETRESFLALAGSDDWRGYQKLRELQRLFAAHVWPSLLLPLQSRQRWQSLMNTPLAREAWNAFVEHPLGEAIERLLRNDVIRGLVFTDAKIGVFTRPHDASLLQNRCFLLHVIGNGTGEWQVPIGGMGALAAELTRVATHAGVDLVSETAAEAIEIGSPRHTISFKHQDQDSSVKARRVLVNAGPQVFAQLLGESFVPPAIGEGSVCKVNLLLHRLPKLKAEGIRPEDAFSGTFHVNETYSEMQTSYDQAATGRLPINPPFEMYCHTLTDDSILGPELRADGYHTLTMFGLDVPYRLFKPDNAHARGEILSRYLQALNRVLREPIEECVAKDSGGNLCVEVMSPVDLEQALSLPCGNIFHGPPSWFFTDDPEQVGKWGVETRYPRLYLCGSSALRGGGVSGIPGHNAAQAVFAESSRSKSAVG